MPLDDSNTQAVPDPPNLPVSAPSHEPSQVSLEEVPHGNFAKSTEADVQPSAQLPEAGNESARCTPVFLEIFCGLARLSKAARRSGFPVPVDDVMKAQGIKVLPLDLCTAKAVPFSKAS